MGIKWFYAVQVNKSLSWIFYIILLTMSKQGDDLMAVLRAFHILGPMNICFHC